MKPSRRVLAALLLSFTLACGSGGTSGGGGDDDVQPIDAAAIDAPALPADAALPPLHLISGGGVAGPAIAGAVNVFVVEAGGDQPVANAVVRVGGATAAAPLTGTASQDGVITFIDARLTGPQTITVTAAGHTAVTWIGVAGANVTIPLTPQPRTTPVAHVAGTIAGWSDLAAPSFGHYTLGVVLATFTGDVGAPENQLPQAMNNGTPANTCTRTSAVPTTCAWQLTTRVGRQRHVAVIVDGDAHGTASDTSDDTFTLIGYAASAGMTLTANQQVSSESLARVAAGALTSFTVSFPAAPAGLAKVVAIPMLDLGADGRIAFPLPTVAPGHTQTQVIAPSGEFAGSYRLVALATPSGTSAMPYSTVFMNSASPGTTAAIDPWLAAPTQLAVAAGTYSFTDAGAAAIHYATFSRADGTALWSVAVLDGARSFALPGVSPDPLGSGALTLTVLSTDVTGFQAGDFQVATLSATLHRAAAASTTITH